MTSSLLMLLMLAAPPAGWPAVESLYRERIAQAEVVGSSLLLVKDGAVAARVHHGTQDGQVPVDDATIFHWASITKTMTGIAILQLRDRDLLSLDDPVVQYVPELRLVHDPYGPISKVTIRQLMSHSAGFRSSTWPWGGDQDWHPFEPTSWSQLVAMLPYTKLEFAPGTQYAYSNPGVVFLGRIIETLSGDDYEVYVTKNILMPLGMTRSFFDRAPYHLVAHRSHSYVRDASGLHEQRFDFDSGITVSNGGLNAPLGDMARYVAFLLGRGEVEILKRASLEEMWTPQVPARAGEGTNAGESWAALSFFVDTEQGVRLIGHSGDQNGFTAHLYLHPPSGTGWLVAFNTDTPAARALDVELREAMVREMLKPR